MKLVDPQTLALHPDADRVPLMSVLQLTQFTEDIKHRGIKIPIEVIDGSVIVDGRSRWLVAKELGIKRVPVIDAPIGDEAPLLYMLRAATKRRHLTDDQLACLALEEMEFIAAVARSERARAGGLAGGRGRVKPDDCSADDAIAELTRDRSTDARAVVCTRYGVSERRVRYAQLIKMHSPLLFKRVHSGQERLAVAKREVERTVKRERLNGSSSHERKDGVLPWEIRCGDCLEELQTIDTGSVRLVFADPPYNMGVDYGSGHSADKLRDDAYLDWCRAWIAECDRLLTADGSLWVMINDEYADHLGIILREVGLSRRSWIKWYETFGVNCANNFNRCSRHIFYMVKDAKSFVFNAEAVSRASARQTTYHDKRANPNGKLWDNVWCIPRLVENSHERLPDFPTQLPLSLVRPIVECASQPGDLIVDPFCGSGTTGVAAIGSQRRFVGIEKSKKFANASTQRLALTLA